MTPPPVPGMLRRLATAWRRRTGSDGGAFIHIPDDLRNPSGVVVAAGSSGYDIWPALHLLDILSRAYPGTAVTALTTPDDAELLAFLGRSIPSMVYGTARRGGDLRDQPAAGLVFAVSERPDPALSDVLRRYPSSVRIAARGEPAANLSADLASIPNPRRLAALCGMLGIPAEQGWRPAVPRTDTERASSLLSPVSGRVLPYIASSASTAVMLERSGAEIPMRMVVLDGRESPLQGHGAAVRAAVIAGASAVATDDPSCWAAASSLGVPVAGLDRRGVFPLWQTSPSSDRSSFLASWADLLRQGW